MCLEVIPASEFKRRARREPLDFPSMPADGVGAKNGFGANNPQGCGFSEFTRNAASGSRAPFRVFFYCIDVNLSYE
jgi:hypothetical protein